MLALLLYGQGEDSDVPIIGMVPMDEAHLSAIEDAVTFMRETAAARPALRHMKLGGFSFFEYMNGVPDAAYSMAETQLVVVDDAHFRATTSCETTTLSLQRDDNGTIFLSFDLTPRHELEIASDPCTPADLVGARLFLAHDEAVPALFDRLITEGPGYAASVFLDGVRAGWVGDDDANEVSSVQPRGVAHLIEARTLLPLLESNCLEVALRQRLIAALGTTKSRGGRTR